MRLIVSGFAAMAAVLALSQAPAQASSLQEYVNAKYRQEFVVTKPAVPAHRMADLIQAKSRKYRIDPIFMASLVYHESNFRPRMVSDCGALGLGQVMPLHWRAYGYPIHLWSDPAVNLDLTCRVFSGFRRWVVERYPGISPQDVRHRSLVAYNAGRGTVSRGVYRSRYSISILNDIRGR